MPFTKKDINLEDINKANIEISEEDGKEIDGNYNTGLEREMSCRFGWEILHYGE